MELFYEDAGVLYKYLLMELVNNGYNIKVKDRLTKEILGMHLILNDPLKNIILSPTRHINLRFAVAEWLWIMKGRNDVEYLAQYVHKMWMFSDDGSILSGAYGPKIMEQMEYVTNTLGRDNNSRQAVMTIWERNPPPSKDIPCTIALQFIIRDDKLNMFVNMRSSDAWLGIPYDIFSFTMIQNYLAYMLHVDLGKFHMFLGSSHLYMDNLGLAQEVALEFAPHGRSHNIALSKVVDREYPLKYWEEMLVSKEETRKRISAYDIEEESFDFPGIDAI